LLVLFLFSSRAFLQSRPAKDTPPVNRYGLVLKYRKAGGDDFKAAGSYSLECFQDAGGKGIFISQTGALGVVPRRLFKVVEGKEKGPLAQHGFVLRVRKADGKTVKFGIECYLDENSGSLIYLSETGSISVVAAKDARRTKDKPKGAAFLHRLSVKVRKPGERAPDEAAKVYGIDVFADSNNDNVVYLGETGSIAVVPKALLDREATSGKSAIWKYGFGLSVRSGRKKGSRKYSVEFYRDSNNGCLICVADNGNITVVPSRLARFPEAEARGLRFRGGMVLATRKPDEKAFSRSTRRFGVEFYADPNSGNLVYLSDAGGLAVVAGREE
jgi:hypothetical protein